MKHVAALFLVLSLAAPAWAEAPGASDSIRITGKQMGVPVDGQFKQFSAHIQFDPAKPSAGEATVDVDVASIDIGLEDFNHELRSKTWFDAKNHPRATFVSSEIKAVGPDRFEVSGTLTIKGVTREVTVPVRFTTEKSTRVFDGALTIRRNDFNVGEGEWKDTGTVADDVAIHFHLLAPVK